MTLGALIVDYLLANKTHFTVLTYEYLFGETLLSLVLGKGYKKLFSSAAIHRFWLLPTDSINSELEFLPKVNFKVRFLSYSTAALPSDGDLPK